MILFLKGWSKKIWSSVEGKMRSSRARKVEGESCGFWVERSKQVHTGIKVKQLSADKKGEEKEWKIWLLKKKM